MVYAFCFIGLLASALVFIAARAMSKHPSERGREAIIKSLAEGKIGSSSFRPPFFRIALYDDLLVLSSAKKLIVPLSAISEVDDSRFKDGHLEIKFHNPSDWPFVSIKLKDNQEFKTQLLTLIQT